MDMRLELFGDIKKGAVFDAAPLGN